MQFISPPKNNEYYQLCNSILKSQIALTLYKKNQQKKPRKIKQIKIWMDTSQQASQKKALYLILHSNLNSITNLFKNTLQDANHKAYPSSQSNKISNFSVRTINTYCLGDLPPDLLDSRLSLDPWIDLDGLPVEMMDSESTLLRSRFRKF